MSLFCRAPFDFDSSVKVDCMTKVIMCLQVIIYNYARQTLKNIIENHLTELGGYFFQFRTS